MTDDEFLQLRILLRTWWKETGMLLPRLPLYLFAFTFFVGFVGGLLQGGIWLICLAFGIRYSSNFILHGAFVLGLAFGMFGWVVHVWELLQRRIRLQQDQAERKVEVFECTAEDAVKAEAHCTANPAFFLNIGHSNLLFVSGEKFLELEKSGTFPNERFDVVRLPISKYCINVLCRGESLRSVPSLDLDLASDSFKDWLTVFPGTLGTLEADIQARETARQSKKS